MPVGDEVGRERVPTSQGPEASPDSSLLMSMGIGLDSRERVPMGAGSNRVESHGCG